MQLTKKLVARLQAALLPAKDYPALRLLVRLKFVAKEAEAFAGENIAALNREADALLREHARSGASGRPVLEGALIVQSAGTYSSVYREDARLASLRRAADSARDAYTQAQAALDAYKETRLLRRTRDKDDPATARLFDVRIL